ncbi:two-component system sensor histidine kinase NtrB [Desulfogranum mediterraneum]|uniref:two-component system sensor histidine kinase NtrB n=1 Tax=Desulfogranum mediterraneum TaxID=160661 RepID=UPI00048F4469|nr:ATP-binding protein [Desulfogranum mediterraneum]
MGNTTALIRSRLLFASPWLLAAAAGLLVIIIVTFAFHNLRLEKRLMTNAMLQKATTLMNVAQSGARASYLADLRKNFWESEPWQEHAQRVLRHLIEDPEIKELALIDEQGRVTVHSDGARVGTTRFSRPPQLPGSSAEPTRKMYYTIEERSSGRVLEAIRPFTPFPSLGHHRRGPGQGPPSHRGGFFMEERGRRSMMRSMRSRLPGPGDQDKQYFILVGLDMAEYDQTLGRLRFQIFILSLAMLLIGVAGWFSLSVVQGYRVSQKTLDEIQAFTSLLISSLPVGLIATNRLGRIATWNHAVTEMTGICRAEAVGTSPQAILPPALAAFFAAKTPSPGSGAEQEEEVRLRIQGRDQVLLCRLIQIYTRDQQYMGEVLLLSDISQLKQLEQKMREHERLAAIGKMAGGVAHEVRNPLSSIKGLALLLKNKFQPGSKEQDTAELLIQETERMNRTISELLSFSRPLPLHLEEVDIGELLARELELISAEISDSHIQVSLELAPDLPPVRGDRDRLTQVIMNILLNSLQAMGPGGELQLEAMPAGQPGSVEIRIRDNGVGMDEETLSQVFYPYFTTKARGTGIGLAISQKIVADHEGTMTIESQPGEGTLVCLHLPVASGPNPTEPLP